MGLFSQWVLTDEIEIKAAPEKIWEFFVNLEKNYIDWHPEDHKKFIWDGEPMTTGTKWYAEEIMHGHLFKLKGRIGEVIPNKKIVFKYGFPAALVSPKFEWILTPTVNGTKFTANGYLYAGDFYSKVGKKEMTWKIAESKRHTKEEGENLKRLMETRSIEEKK